MRMEKGAQQSLLVTLCAAFRMKGAPYTQNAQGCVSEGDRRSQSTLAHLNTESCRCCRNTWPAWALERNGKVKTRKERKTEHGARDGNMVRRVVAPAEADNKERLAADIFVVLASELRCWYQLTLSSFL